MKTQFLVLFILSLNVLGYSQTGFIPGEPKLAFWEIGKKNHTIIVLHGGPCAEHQYLRPEFDGLRKSARVIFYDQRGCGQSALADSYQWRDHVDDLNRVIQNQAPNGKVFLAGSSWGSLLALLFAYTYPNNVDGLILSGLVWWDGREMSDSEYDKYKIDRLKDVKDPDIYRFELNEYKFIEVVLADGSIAKVYKEINRPAILNTGMRFSETFASLATTPAFDSLARIQTPCLIFNGPAPCIYDKEIRKYANVLPNSWVVSIDESCHDPWLLNPKLFQDKSNNFVKALRKGKINLAKINKKLN